MQRKRFNILKWKFQEFVFLVVITKISKIETY